MLRPLAFWYESQETDRSRVSLSHTRGSISGSLEESPVTLGLKSPTSKTSAPIAVICRATATLVRLFIDTPLTKCRSRWISTRVASLYRLYGKCQAGGFKCWLTPLLHRSINRLGWRRSSDGNLGTSFF